jgi:beta-N-acetylhexosaminidase
VAALQAGCDLVLLCNQSVDGGAAVDALLDGLTRAQAGGGWLPDAESEARRHRLLPAAPAPDWAALQAEPAYRDARRRLG